jgi:hypothetical protein
VEEKKICFLSPTTTAAATTATPAPRCAPAAATAHTATDKALHTPSERAATEVHSVVIVGSRVGGEILTIYLFIYFLLREKKIKTFKFFFVVGVLV